ncbi:MAG: hypothetical protein ACM3X6_12520 [Patescibacteria group bacterium]
MKSLIGAVLALVLVFAFAGTAMAAPFEVDEAGEFFIFGDYSYYSGGPSSDFTLGLGYALTDKLAVGVQYMTDIFNTWPYAFGAFAVLDLHPIVIRGEYMYFPLAPFSYGNASVLYTFDVKALTFGLGVGASFYPWDTDFYIEAMASVDLGKDFSLYGTVYYVPSQTEHGFVAGVSLAF